MNRTLPAKLSKLVDTRLKRCGNCGATDFQRLFLKWPEAHGDEARSYYLADPASLDRKGVAGGVYDESINERWCVIVVGKISVACLIINDGEEFVTFDTTGDDQTNWRAEMSWLFEGHGKGVLVISTPTIEIEYAAGNQLRMHGKNGSQKTLLATISSEVKMPKYAQQSGVLVATDCVFDQRFGSEYLHVAAALTAIRMWLIGADFSSGG
jgi:hypothetical protein